MTVGGAQRKNRRIKQDQTAKAAAAVAAARGVRKDSTKIIIGVIVVVLVAAGVVGGVLYSQHQKNVSAETIIPAKTVPGSSSYPQVLDKANATVLVGKPTAKVTLDAYEDFECPICDEFEASNFTDIEKQLEAGTIQVRYHMLNLLDNSSSPPGYSSLAANTALAVATVAPEKFMDIHYSLYQKQPEEGKAGWTQAQLTSLANRLGVSGATFNNLINNGTYKAQINKNMLAANSDQSLYQTDSDGTKGFGTPTIVYNGQPVNYQTTGWLETIINSAKSKA
ncbi:MAG TPA: thioredoxin domain-containing protein [Pseudonocardiaceae bacterium]|nr:thioredoxin domain-containing protein [Pseudonocardiaceae bacterium]